MKLFLHSQALGELPVPHRLFYSNLVYVCPRCGTPWGRVEAWEGKDFFPVARGCRTCPPSPSPRHTPGSFYQYYTDFSQEYFEAWTKALASADFSVLAWEFDRHLDYAP